MLHCCVCAVVKSFQMQFLIIDGFFTKKVGIIVAKITNEFIRLSPFTLIMFHEK